MTEPRDTDPSGGDATDLASEPTQVSAEVPLGPDDDLDPSFDGDLAGEATQAAAAPEPSFEEERLTDLPGEPTHAGVTSVPDSEERVPPLGELAMEPTLPAASRPSQEPAAAGAVAGAPPLAAVSDRPVASDLADHPPIEATTQLVAPDAGDGETYSLDVDSLRVEAAPRGDAGARGRAGTNPLVFVVFGVAALVALSGLAFLGWVMMTPLERADPEPPAAASVGPPPDPAPGESRPAPEVAPPAGGQPAAGGEPAVDEEPEDEDGAADEGDGEADEEDDEDPGGSSEPVPREELEGFELDRPRVGARARRMSESERRRAATRYRGQALRAYRDHEYAEAERFYRAAMTFNSWDVAAVEGLARATARQGRYPEALAWARLAVERNPRSAEAYRVLGDVWRQAGHPDQAAEVYRRGLARSPRDRWLRRRLREVTSG